ncbi:MAG TPA: mechanosensitive ion channel family protein [Candidatus Acidoferrales bacterium]|nr:mechanosensitive ion channel family protein [Candidatus Acidoferrales bacterium]
MLTGLTIREVFVVLAIAAGVLLALAAILWLAGRVVRRFAHRLEERHRAHVTEIERWAQQFTQLLRRTVMAITAVLALFFLLRRLGMRREVDWADVAARLTGASLRILLIIIGAYFLGRFLQMLVSRLPLLVGRREGGWAERLEREKRVATLTRLLGWISTGVVIGIAVLLILRDWGVNITPILTGAGIAGLAVGFGAQNLVRDVISGFFLILEDQVRVGDVVTINGKSGLVESIQLRTTRLRDFDGTVHILPNGAITELSNLTKDFSYYVINLGVAYKEDVDRVMATLREVGGGLETDPAFRDFILAPLEVVGVDAFADSAVVIKMRIKTVPRQQWVVGRELRRRIKKAFDDRGIEIPYPHLSVYFGEASKPIAVQVTDLPPGGGTPE